MEASVQGYPPPSRIYKREGGYVTPEEYKSLEEEYKPNVLGKKDLMGQQSGSEFGADVLMMWRLIDCLHNGLPLDMDVYDGVSMSSVLPLSEWSVNNGSYPINIPDFTKGAWKTNKPNMDISLSEGGDTKLRRNESFERILLSVSAILVLMGVIVISPVGGVFFLAFGCILSMIALLCSKKYRYIALVLLLISIAILLGRYFQAKRHYESHRKLAMKASAQIQNLRKDVFLYI